MLEPPAAAQRISDSRTARERRAVGVRTTSSARRYQAEAVRGDVGVAEGSSALRGTPERALARDGDARSRRRRKPARISALVVGVLGGLRQKREQRAAGLCLVAGDRQVLFHGFGVRGHLVLVGRLTFFLHVFGPVGLDIFLGGFLAEHLLLVCEVGHLHFHRRDALALGVFDDGFTSVCAEVGDDDEVNGALVVVVERFDVQLLACPLPRREASLTVAFHTVVVEELLPVGVERRHALHVAVFVLFRNEVTASLREVEKAVREVGVHPRADVGDVLTDGGWDFRHHASGNFHVGESFTVVGLSAVLFVVKPYRNLDVDVKFGHSKFSLRSPAVTLLFSAGSPGLRRPVVAGVSVARDDGRLLSGWMKGGARTAGWGARRASPAVGVFSAAVRLQE